ncbi:MAG: hypothetical protein AAF721_12560 [Myxococcota bacterium]
MASHRSLYPCPHCAVHIKRAESSCPACGGSVSRSAWTTAPLALPLVLGISMAACGPKQGTTTPPTDPPVSDDGGGGDDGSVGADDGASLDGGADDGMDEPMPEPEYGVAATEDE